MLRTLEDFCRAVYPGLPPEQFRKNIHQLAAYADNRKRRKSYQECWIPKKHGGARRILAPSSGLKQIQRTAAALLAKGDVSSCATAYRTGYSILENAVPHTGRELLVKLDIRDFFGSIRFPAVFHAIDNALRRNPEVGRHCKAYPRGCRESRNYNSVLSFYLAQFCTLNGVLPQGAPSSPVLSNLVFYPLDCRIAAYCKKRSIQYTRYSDDMTFSGCFHPGALIRFVRRLLAEYGFTLNEEKTVLAGRGCRKSVTGVTVNETPQASRSYRRNLRQQIYYIRRFGLREHLLHLGRTEDAGQPERYLRQLLGKVSFVLQICPEDSEFQHYRAYCLGLLRAHTGGNTP
ncbi:reverse transcriptase family protein [Clostridium sp. D33t1_170424_F3]|uniref:reverse transcriptase family protein n=1 Tax=Clostridium sp. D33t1_170424_F3 TaxID=2787099 RepID=UPI0018AAF71D|nr:reverse transcriptase family protein [Clostridium sp. D33t1_170424_F3]